MERWPYTAIEPSRLLAFGLISILALGLGLIPWAIGLGMLIWRLPASLHWRLVKHATWLSLLGVVACIAWALFDQPKSKLVIDIGNDTVITIFTASLLVHYICTFLIAIGITYSAKIYVAMGLAAVCLMTTGATVLVALVTEKSMAAVAMTLTFSGAFWMLLGTFYWAHVANTLYEQKQALLRVSLDLPREPPPTQTL